MKQKDIFKKNQKFLLKYKPQIAGYIKQPEKIETLKCLYNAEISKMILDEEYTKHKTLIDHCSTGLVFCVEPFILKQLFEKYSYRHMFLFFPSTDYFNQMLCNYDFSELIKKDSFKPIFGETEEIIERNIMYNCEKVDIMHSGVRIFAYNPFDKINKKLIEMVTTVLHKISNSIMININTSVKFGNNIFINDIRSLDKQIKYQTIEQFRGISTGKPVICVAAGPSLNNQFEALRSIAGEVFIVAAMACYKPLLKNGIKADIYTCIDMDDIIEKYFIDTDLTGVNIAIEMSCYWGVMERHPEANYFVSQSSADGKPYINNILETLKIRIPEGSRIHGGMTVAMMSIQIANLMGASKILLVGSDLCYNEAASHVEGSDHNSSVQIVKSDDGREWLGFEQYGEVKNIILPLFWEPGNDGKPKPTTMQFQTYRNYMTHFFNMHDLHPINCTDTGMAIPGCEYMSLTDALLQYHDNAVDTDKTIKVVPNKDRVAGTINESLESIAVMIESFKSVKILADTGIELFKAEMPDFDKINEIIRLLLQVHTDITNLVSQNNIAGYYLYKYLELAKPEGVAKSIDNRNKARLLFHSISEGLELFINEYERSVKRIKELYTP